MVTRPSSNGSVASVGESVRSCVSMESNGRISTHCCLRNATSSSPMFPSSSAAARQPVQFNLSKPFFRKTRFEKRVPIQPVAADASGRSGSGSSHSSRTSKSAASKSSNETQLYTSTGGSAPSLPPSGDIASLVVGGGAILVVGFGTNLFHVQLLVPLEHFLVLSNTLVAVCEEADFILRY